jgi:hypothetical protein
MNRAIGLLAVGAFAAAFASVGQASIISDSLTVYDPTGAVFAQVSVAEDVEDPNTIYFISNLDFPDLVDPTQLGNATGVFEPDGSLSDVFGLISSPVAEGLCLAFSSDSETVPAAFVGAGSSVFQERDHQGIFDATMYLNPDLQAQGYTATFVSDSEVPEPTTLTIWSMLGALGISVGWWRRWKAA